MTPINETIIIWLVVILSFLLGWEWKKAIDSIKADMRKAAQDKAIRESSDRAKKEDAKRRWDASLEAIEELFEK